MSFLVKTKAKVPVEKPEADAKLQEVVIDVDFIFTPKPGEMVQFDLRIFFAMGGSTTNTASAVCDLRLTGPGAQA